MEIQLLRSISDLDELMKDAEVDGGRMVSRLVQEWMDGTNRFALPGERVYLAWIAGRVVGVCGLNKDPFALDSAVGRVRRLYVMSDFRRRGIGSAILDRLIADARANFRMLHLRTHDPAAMAFYKSHGFSEAKGDPNHTHFLSLHAAR